MLVSANQILVRTPTLSFLLNKLALTATGTLVRRGVKSV